MARERGLGEVEAFGLGGPLLESQGFERVVDARGLLAMGFFEIATRLPAIRNALATLVQVAAARKPDLAVFVDYPDFHFRLVKRFYYLGIPTVYYIPPKVWVWRRERIHALKQYFTKVLCILPFEEEFHKKHGGNAKYVGNPLLDELPLNLKRNDARVKLGLSATDRVLVLMPGSRPHELRHHIELMLEGAVRAAAELRSSGAMGADEVMTVLIPMSRATNDRDMRPRIESWLDRMGANFKGSARRFILDVRLSKGDADVCLAAADVGLIKSGTSSLEAALMGCAHTVVYRTNFFTAFVFKYLIRYRGPVSLPNLILSGNREDSERVVKELLLGDATTEKIGKEVSRLFHQPEIRGQLETRLKRIQDLLRVGDQSPSRLAAQELLGVLGK